MGFLDTVRAQLRPSAAATTDIYGEAPAPSVQLDVDTVDKSTAAKSATAEQVDRDVDEEKRIAIAAHASGDRGVAAVEAVQAIWGTRGRTLVIVGLCLVMIVYELDNSTVYVYNNYSTSSFRALSELSTLSTAATIVFAVVKPPIAKIADLCGRGQTYAAIMLVFVVGHVLMASASGINSYAAGLVLYTVGQSGTNLLNDITVADITTARWRGFAIGMLFWPFLITPWIAAYITASVVAARGIGWRWGIGMFAILLPACAALIIGTLLFYQRRARRLALVAPRATRMTVYDFCAHIDLGGTLLLVAGLAMVLLPLTLAATSPHQWRTPYLVALIAVGALLLVALPLYEARVATNPVVPVAYFRNRTIALCLLLIALDSLGVACTHTYLYSWGAIAHNMSARDNTFYTYTNGVTQCLAAIAAGLVMARTRRYKYLTVAGVAIRTVGYGVMLRLRGATNSYAELFLVQAVQGVGSGIVQGVLLVPAQISVPHAQLAQVTALVITTSFVGASIGSCIAGGIYTNTFKDALRHHLGTASEPLIESLFNSITTTIPAWGSPDRTAINFAYSDVLRYMTYTAFGASVPGLLLAWLLPNHRLPDMNNLIDG